MAFIRHTLDHLQVNPVNVILILLRVLLAVFVIYFLLTNISSTSTILTSTPVVMGLSPAWWLVFALVGTFICFIGKGKSNVS